MKLIIVGGDKVAYYLCKQLLDKHYNITVIENRRIAGERIANELEVDVLHGDGTNREVLRAAGCDTADMLIALTGLDEANLIACQLAKHYFGIRTTVAKINNPKNQVVFKLFGVDKAFSSSQLLADIIDQEIEYQGMHIAFSIPDNTKAIIDFKLSPTSRAVGKTLQEYNFPGDAKLVLITRGDGTVEMPRGDIVMQAGDSMLAVVDEKYFDVIWKNMVEVNE